MENQSYLEELFNSKSEELYILEAELINIISRVNDNELKEKWLQFQSTRQERNKIHLNLLLLKNKNYDI